MSGKEWAGIGIMVSGAGVLAGALLADALGFGNEMGFGQKQTAGVIVGVVIMFLGLMVRSRAR